MKMNNNGKGNDGFRTPDFFYNDLNKIFSFTVDAACTTQNAKHPHGFFFDQGINGLNESWSGHRVFCNPPFSKKIDWIKKAVHEIENNNCICVVMVLPSNSMSSTVWFTHIFGRYLYEIIERRVAFLDDNGKPVSGNNSGTVLVYFKKKQKNVQ